ncbi:Gluconate permease [Bacillus subtilis subsp. subtilis]|nr:Gluconate permease [Bacillus subtilis subsp. subtilis]
MPLIIVALGILALLFLIMGLKLNTFISLLVVSFGVALALGMPFDKVVSSIEAGIGGLLATSRSSLDSVRCWAS